MTVPFGLARKLIRDFMTLRTLIVIPAYNEEASIARVLANLRQVVPNYDLLVVNDGSEDATSRTVESLGVKQLKLPCNLGYGRAIQTGLRYALAHDYDIVVTFDADGQHRPQDIVHLVSAFQQYQVDMIIGSRFCDGSPYNTPLGRRLGQLLFSYLTRILTGKRIYDTSSGFKILSARMCEMIVDGAFMDFHTETIVWASMFGLKVMEVPIVVEERLSGRSMHSLASIFLYPPQTLLLTLVAIMDALIARRNR